MTERGTPDASVPEGARTDGARLSEAFLAELDNALAADDARLRQEYPGDAGTRQPVHTVYVPADRVARSTASDWGQAALALFDQVAPDASAAGSVSGLGAAVTAEVHARVRAKLTAQPVEDLRIDLEDGYGTRSDADEDGAALNAADVLRATMAAPGGPSFGGIRFKSFEAPTRRRGVRSLDLFLGRLCADGAPPDGLVLTLPKVTSVDQVAAMANLCAHLEEVYRLPAGRLRFEIQVETPQAILGADGTAAVAAMVHAGGARVVGLHYGTYDYSAACGVAAEYQSLEHPVADHAKAVMQVAAAGTGVRLSDGSTNVLPVGTPDQVQAALSLHARLVRRSLVRGYYQGWDMHPGHLVTRYLATFAFYQESSAAATRRLRAYLQGVEGAVMDEPATAQALAGFLTRGVHCGALDAGQVEASAGADLATLDALARRLRLPAGANTGTPTTTARTRPGQDTP